MSVEIKNKKIKIMKKENVKIEIIADSKMAIKHIKKAKKYAKKLKLQLYKLQQIKIITNIK